MPFFVKKSSNKRKTAKSIPKPENKTRFQQKLEKRLRKDEIDSDEEEVIQKKLKGDDEEEQLDEEYETALEKKERLAKQYIQELQDQKAAESDSDTDGVTKHLQDEVLEQTGKLFRKVASSYEDSSRHAVSVHKCKKYQWKPTTCVVIHPSKGYIYSSSLNGSIVKYNSSGKVLSVIKSKLQLKGDDVKKPAHKKEIYCLAISSDGKYLVSGDGEGIIHVWDAETLAHIDRLKRHRGAVTGLTFQLNTDHLYSCSADRLVMEWSLENMTYVDNLGGHSCGVQAIDSMYRQSCITCGGADETVIVYAIEDDKQFQFTGKQTSIDGVKLLNEKTFLTYGQDGSVCLWSTSRKKPLQQLKVAHGYRNEATKEPHWITALATLINTDLIATGSSDGFIRLWRADGAEPKKLHALCRIAIPAGVVNSLQFDAKGKVLVAALARSHKHGRWFVEKAQNCILIIKLNCDEQQNGDGEEAEEEENEMEVDSDEGEDSEQEENDSEEAEQAENKMEDENSGAEQEGNDSEEDEELERDSDNEKVLPNGTAASDEDDSTQDSDDLDETVQFEENSELSDEDENR